MKQVKLTIKENRLIAENVFRMVLYGDVSAVTAPGQFINLLLPGHFLRRPISVCDVSYDDSYRSDSQMSPISFYFPEIGEDGSVCPGSGNDSGAFGYASGVSAPDHEPTFVERFLAEQAAKENAAAHAADSAANQNTPGKDPASAEEPATADDNDNNDTDDSVTGFVTILYKIAGEGTAEMAGLPAGTELDVLTGLGNGFDIKKVRAGETALLLGGGIGSAPMLMLTKKLKERGVSVQAVLGFNTAADVILAEELHEAGACVTVMTADGSYGCPDAADRTGFCGPGINSGKGFATDSKVVRSGDYRYFYACGPMPMLKAVYKACHEHGELSFEERMGCGFGACMGCTMHTASGPKRVCKDGPVFEKKEILWD